MEKWLILNYKRVSAICIAYDMEEYLQIERGQYDIVLCPGNYITPIAIVSEKKPDDICGRVFSLEDAKEQIRNGITSAFKKKDLSHLEKRTIEKIVRDGDIRHYPWKTKERTITVEKVPQASVVWDDWRNEWFLYEEPEKEVGGEEKQRYPKIKHNAIVMGDYCGQEKTKNLFIKEVFFQIEETFSRIQKGVA